MWKNEKKIIESAPSILDYLSEPELNHFNQVKRYLDKLGIPYTVDKGLVRGLDYYTMTTFEIRTNSIGRDSAKSPIDMFANLFIPNMLGNVIEACERYYK